MTLQHPDYWPTPAHGTRGPWSEATTLLAGLPGSAEPDRPATAAEPAPPALALHDAYRHCDGITRRHSRSFFLSSRFLPAEKRQAIRALYAFCCTSDDIVDNPTGEAGATLARWVALAQAPPPPPDDPVLLAWHDTATHYAVPQALIDELLAAWRWIC